MSLSMTLDDEYLLFAPPTWPWNTVVGGRSCKTFMVIFSIWCH